MRTQPIALALLLTASISSIDLPQVIASEPPSPKPAAKSATTHSDSTVDSLIAAERAFSRAAGERGIQAAFLEFLADDAVLFRPGPVNGKTWLREHPPDPGRLWWEPAHVEVASSGDLGLSTGPWNYTVAGGTEPVAFGQFASVWRRRPDGRWEVVLDHGISHPPASTSSGSATPPAPSQVTAPERRTATGGGGDRDSLLAADRAFDAALMSTGAAATYRSPAAHAEVRVLRSGNEPVVGREAAAGAVSGDEQLRWDSAFAQVSRSGDFGYTHGTARSAAAPDEPARQYARVWRREGGGPWQVVLDVAPAAPRPAPAPPAPAANVPVPTPQPR